MEIEPVQPVTIIMKSMTGQSFAQLIKLSDLTMEVSADEYYPELTPIQFQSNYFRGSGTVEGIEFNRNCFRYTLKLEHIQFKPGLVINTRL